jgi:hypothetical protein
VVSEAGVLSSAGEAAPKVAATAADARLSM